MVASPVYIPLGLSSLSLSLSSLSEFDTNGLPRLPASVACYSRLHFLRSIHHDNLCRYLDAIREKSEVILIITEHYITNLSSFCGPTNDTNWLCQKFSECLLALQYMDDHGLIHGFLNPASIMLDPNGCIKIGGFGTYYVTEWGSTVDYILADHIYSAPELFLIMSSDECRMQPHTMLRTCPLTIECDIWSLGMIFFELLHGRLNANPLHHIHSRQTGGTLCETVRLLLKGLSIASKHVTLPEFLNVSISLEDLDYDTRKVDGVFRRCLYFHVSQRPSPQTLIDEMALILCRNTNNFTFDFNRGWPYELYPKKNINSHFHYMPIRNQVIEICQSVLDSDQSKANEFVSNITDLAELYYYWKLAGGKPSVIAKQRFTYSIGESDLLNNCEQTNALLNEVNSPTDCSSFSIPILRIPHYLALTEHASSRVLCSREIWPSGHKPKRRVFDATIIPLPSHRFIRRISRMPLHYLYPLIVGQNFRSSENSSSTNVLDLLKSNFDLHNVHLLNKNQTNCYTPEVINSDRRNFVHLLFSSPSDCKFNNNNNNDYNNNTDDNDDGYSNKAKFPNKNSICNQPLCIREADVDYQIYRVRLFNRLLHGLPATRKQLRCEARKDIPPFLRCKIWAALLDACVDSEFETLYFKLMHAINTKYVHQLSKEESDSSIRVYLDDKVLNQIAVDLPRCHAYDVLLASDLGQAMLRRVLIITLLMKPGLLDYTQGMDSIAAVFVRLCYPNEVLAAACLHAFLMNKLPGFFTSGGLTFSFKSFFAVLLRLFAFHLPKLAVRLCELNVPLIGLTTGWIYTLFAHELPLDRVELLWDTILVGPAVLSMFFYIAAFQQLDRQVNFDVLSLEDICTILSNFPEINLDKCRTDALRMANASPRSLTTLTCTEKFYCVQKSPTANSVQSASVIDGGVISNVTSESDCSKFYQRLSYPDSWPEHLEESTIPVGDFTNCSSDTYPATTVEKLKTLSINTDSLVPRLSIPDAAEHLQRPDCLVLDIRSHKDYNKCHLLGSIHRDPLQVASLTSFIPDGATTCDRSFHESSTALDGWEFVNNSGVSRNRLETIPEFLALVKEETAWHNSVHARQQSMKLYVQANNEISPNSPGLIVIIGLDHQLCCQLAYWLMRFDVDRVCVLAGSFNSLQTNRKIKQRITYF